MQRREFIAGLGATALPLGARAQQPAPTKRIAVVAPAGKVADMKDGPIVKVFDEELNRLGYVEGKNLIIDRYSAEGHPERYGDLAREVVSTNPDVIYAAGAPLTREFKKATSTIPIVASTGDPVRLGIISSLAHPGGNITGISFDAGVEVWGKRLELLAEAVPKLVNVVFVSTKGGWDGAGGKATQEAAQKLGISLVLAPLVSPFSEAEYKRVFNSIQRDQFHGIMISSEFEHYPYRFLIVQLVQELRLPAIYVLREQVEAGGLMSYSVDTKDIVRRNAMQIVEILHGANPGDMPYFQPTKFELVINLKTAKELGLEIPAGLVAGAAAVIE